MKRFLKSILPAMIGSVMLAGCNPPVQDVPPAYANYDNQLTYLATDDYSKFNADHIVTISFGDSVMVKCDNDAEKDLTASSDGKKTLFKVTDPTDETKDLKCQIIREDEGNGDGEATGIVIENKTDKTVKYVFKGEYKGSIKVKNKSSECAIILDGVKITSVNGPVFHITADETRTFIISNSGSTNNLVDGRTLDKKDEVINDNKGSIYANSALIFAGDGTINLTNTGYKHAIYSADYVRIAGVKLNVTVGKDTRKGRDCIRVFNAFIMDKGKVKLEGYGAVDDDESVGIKVEGEDVSNKNKVTYTAGAGFIIINGGELSVNTYAKGITAHWKEEETCIDKIGDGTYTEAKTKSLLAGTDLLDKTATMPNPYVEINGGKITVKTFGKKTENCNPKGIEAKAGLTVNKGCVITIESVGKPLPDEDKRKINGGYVKVNGIVITK